MPTASPIMVATVWAMLGTAITWPSRPIVAERHRQAQDGRPDRHAHRHDRAEREGQDEHRGEDADHVAGDVSLGDSTVPIDAAADHLHAGLSPGLGGVQHALGLLVR